MADSVVSLRVGERMSNFRPKAIFHEAKTFEANGQLVKAADCYARLASYFIRKKKFQEASKLLKHVLKLSPNSVRIHLLLAICDYELGDSQEAHRELREFIKCASNKSRLESYRTYGLEQLQPYPKLRQFYFEIALETDRTGALNFLGLAEALIEQNLLAEAQQTIVNALRTKDRQQESVQLLKRVLESRRATEQLGHLASFCRNQLGLDDFLLLLSEKRNKTSPNREIFQSTEQKSLQDLIQELEAEIGMEIAAKADTVAPLLREFKEKSKKVLGNDAKALMDMALAYFEMGLMEAAQEELSQIRPTDPLYLEAQCLVGAILVSQGSDLAALEIFQSCLRDERSDAEIEKEAFYQLAQIYYRLSDFDQAIRVASELEKVDPSYRDIKTIKTQIVQRIESLASQDEQPALRKVST